MCSAEILAVRAVALGLAGVADVATALAVAVVTGGTSGGVVAAGWHANSPVHSASR